jgi:nitrate/nitrite transporter NarK
MRSSKAAAFVACADLLSAEMGLAEMEFALASVASAPKPPASVAISLRAMIGVVGVIGVIGGLGGGVTNDGAARSLARADFAASICAFKLGFAINSCLY